MDGASGGVISWGRDWNFFAWLLVMAAEVIELG